MKPPIEQALPVILASLPPPAPPTEQVEPASAPAPADAAAQASPPPAAIPPEPAPPPELPSPPEPTPPLQPVQSPLASEPVPQRPQVTPPSPPETPGPAASTIDPTPTVKPDELASVAPLPAPTPPPAQVAPPPPAITATPPVKVLEEKPVQPPEPRPRPPHRSIVHHEVVPRMPPLAATPDTMADTETARQKATPGPQTSPAQEVSQAAASAAQASFEGRLLQIIQAEARRNYPAAARLMGTSGQAVISFEYCDGRVRVIGLARSSGSAALDRAALAAVQDASYPGPPKDLAGKTLRDLVHVEYQLDAS